MAGDGDVDIDIVMGEMDGDLDPTIMSFQASAIIAVCAAVLIGNAFVCALNCLKSSSKKFYLKFVLVATLVNIISALICMPLMAAALLEGEWKYGYTLCKVTGTICFGAMILTMTLCALAAVSKLLLFFRMNFTKLMCKAFFHKDFIISSIVFAFVGISQAVLFILIDSANLSKDPYRVLCKYANSPNITGYRMFFLVYSTLLTLAALILVIPLTSEREKPS